MESRQRRAGRRPVPATRKSIREDQRPLSYRVRHGGRVPRGGSGEKEVRSREHVRKRLKSALDTVERPARRRQASVRQRVEAVGKELMACSRCSRLVRNMREHLKVCKVCRCGFKAKDGEELYRHRMKEHPVCVVMFIR